MSSETLTEKFSFDKKQGNCFNIENDPENIQEIQILQFYILF